jgi:hypothetical protein
MSWTARITKAPDGELRLQFSEPLRRIDMDAATARHLAALLVVAAGEFERITSSDVQAKTSNSVFNTPRAKNSHERLATVTAQPKTGQKHSECFMAEKKPKRLRGGVR